MRPLLAAAVAAAALAGGASAANHPDTSAFAGVGSWIGIFSTASLADPQGAVAAAASHGVRTLYVETSNASRTVDVQNPAALGALLDAAHAQGLRVVAWYLPSFASERLDLRRSLAAIRFRSPTGEPFDAFALDIEATVVKSVALRNVRVARLADAIRRAAGPHYPLGAIVPSPVGLQIHPAVWPGFPWAALARRFDAFLPMAYSTYHVHGGAAARSYVERTIALVRTALGSAQRPIHAIGGVSADMSAGDAAGFVQAVADCAPAGYSLYDLDGTKASAWAKLAAPPPPSRGCG